MTVTIAGETRSVAAVAQNKIVMLDSALAADVAESTANLQPIGYVTVAAASVSNHAGRAVSLLSS